MMANPYHHAVSSVRKWGGKVEDYLPIHDWFDESKSHHGDFRHRFLRHHTEGCFACQEKFGHAIVNSDGRAVPVRWIAEQHVKEDFGGKLPSLSEWASAIQPKDWMNKASGKMLRELEHECPNTPSRAGTVPKAQLPLVLESPQKTKRKLWDFLKKGFQKFSLLISGKSSQQCPQKSSSKSTLVSTTSQ